MIPKFEFVVITGKTIYRLIHENMPECVRVVRDAYLTHEIGQSINPNSYFLRYPEKPSARIIALPAHLSGETNVSGIKWIASFPENVAKGFPRASAVLVLNNCETGYPFACLEGSIISAARTAASALVATEALHRGIRAVKTLGIVGNGLIARYVYDFLVGTGWEIDSVALFDSTPGEASRFANEVCDARRHTSVWICPDVDSLIQASEIVVLATIAAKPHITNFALFAHNPIVLNLSLRDLAPEILLQSNNVVDDVTHVLNAGTSPHLAEQMSGGRSFINGTIAGSIQKSYVVSPSRPTIVSPFGLGILDLAVGKWVYDAACESDEAVHINDFFYDMHR